MCVGAICTLLSKKCVFGQGCAPGTTGGDHSAPPDPLAGLRGPTSKGQGWEPISKGMGRGERERERTPDSDTLPLEKNYWIKPRLQQI